MLQGKGLGKRYGDRWVFRELQLSVQPGQVLGLIGRNGVGKTTLLRILAGTLGPDEGSLSLGARSYARCLVEVKKKLAFVPEGSALPGEMHVDAFVRYVAAAKGVTGAAARKQCTDALECLELGEIATASIASLSRGLRQRLALAAAFIGEPSLVVFDEPSTGLDPMQRQQLWALIARLRKRAGVVLSSHNSDELSETCTDLFVLRADGQEARGFLLDSLDHNGEFPDLEELLVGKE